MVCDVQLNSDIASFKALGDNLSFKTAVQQHIVGVESGAPKYIDCSASRYSVLARPLSVPSDVLRLC